MWNKDWTNAPKDKQVLARHPDWDCPTCIQWHPGWAEDDVPGFWHYSEQLLWDVEPEISPDVLANAEWMVIPD